MLCTFDVAGVSPETLAYQPHAATTAIQQRLDDDWFSAASNYTIPLGFSSLAEYKYADHLLSSTTTTVPFVRVRCSAVTTNLTRDVNEVIFPWLNEGIEWVDDDRKASIATLNRTSSPFLRIQWLPLPVEQFGNISTGLLIELPSIEYSDSRAAFGCSVSAVWTQARVFSDSTFSQYACISQMTTNFTEQKIVANLSASSPNAAQSNRLVVLDPSWLDALTPSIPDGDPTGDSWPPNTLERIMTETRVTEVFNDYLTRTQYYDIDGQCELTSMPQNWTQTDMWNDRTCGKGNKGPLLESIVAIAIADGLSRFASSHVYNTAPSMQD